MNEVIVTNQDEWNALPKKFDEYTRIIIKSNDRLVIESNPSNSSAVLWGSSSAVLWDRSSAELWDRSSAELWDSSRAELRGSSSAVLWDRSSAELWDRSSAVLWGSSSAVLWGSSSAKYNNEILLKYLEISPIGSRQSKLQVYITTNATTVRTGCFSGTIDQFKSAISSTHGTSSIAKVYFDAVKFIINIEKQVRK